MSIINLKEVGTHLQTELEKYYQNNLLMRSTATASLLQPEDETPLLQEEKGEFGALRSPIAGDLASPQHGTTPHLLVASSSASSASSASKSSLHSKASGYILILAEKTKIRIMSDRHGIMP